MGFSSACQAKTQSRVVEDVDSVAAWTSNLIFQVREAAGEAGGGRGAYPSVCLSVCLYVCLSVCPSVCLSVRPSVCLSCLSCLSRLSRLFVCFSVCLSCLSCLSRLYRLSVCLVCCALLLFSLAYSPSRTPYRLSHTYDVLILSIVAVGGGIPRESETSKHEYFSAQQRRQPQQPQLQKYYPALESTLKVVHAQCTLKGRTYLADPTGGITFLFPPTPPALPWSLLSPSTLSPRARSPRSQSPALRVQDSLSFDDLAAWYTEEGYKVSPWLELLDLNKWAVGAANPATSGGWGKAAALDF